MKRIIILFVVVLFVVGVFISLHFFADPILTEQAYYTTFENSIPTRAILVRNEFLYNAPQGVSVEYYASEAEKVPYNKKIATVYKEAIPIDIKNQISGLNKKIEEIKAKSLKNATALVDDTNVKTQNMQKANKIIDAVYNNNIASIIQYKNELSGGSSMENTDGSVREINDLTRQRVALECKISSSKSDVYTQQAGIFSSNIDGLEQDFTVDKAKNITTAELETYMQKAKTNLPQQTSNIIAGNPFMKVIQTGKWYVELVLTNSNSEGLNIGNNVILRFTDISEKRVDATIEYISQAENDKKVILLASDKYVEGIYSNRLVNIELIKNSYSGLKVPISAIRVVDGRKGVFANVQGVSVFKPCNILYYNDNFAIVKKDINDAKALCEYDDVIVAGKQIKEGKLVK